jgi:hypothetical protein
MISLTEQQKAFLNKRAKMVRIWPRMGALLIAVEIGEKMSRPDKRSLGSIDKA